MAKNKYDAAEDLAEEILEEFRARSEYYADASRGDLEEAAQNMGNYWIDTQLIYDSDILEWWDQNYDDQVDLRHAESIMAAIHESVYLQLMDEVVAPAVESAVSDYMEEREADKRDDEEEDGEE